MDKLDYCRTYFISTKNFRLEGYEWCKAGVSVEDAIAWDGLGYMPGEAAPLIEAGMTPELAADADSAGGTVLERIARLADAGIDTKGVDLSALDE